MKYRITKFCFDEIELKISDKTITLTNDKPHYVAEEDEYEEILSNHSSLITNSIILISRIKEDIKEEKTKNSKHR